MKKISLVLFMVLLPAAAMAKDMSKAHIVTMIAKPAQCLSSIAVNQIDGEEKRVHPQGFEIDPGLHTITGRAMIDTTFCRVIRSKQAGTAVPPLTTIFEAGKTYFVGLDHSSKDRAEWRLVIWKVE